MSTVVRLELTLAEADLVGAVVSRDRDRVLDERFGNRGTRLIDASEEAAVPVHQEILRKIENGVNSKAPLIKAMDAIVAAVEPPQIDLGKVRDLCETFSLITLHTVIAVHLSLADQHRQAT